MKDEIKINQGKIFYFPKLNKKNYYILIFVICSLFRRLFPFLIESSDFGKVDEENFNKSCLFDMLSNFTGDILTGTYKIYLLFTNSKKKNIRNLTNDNLIEEEGLKIGDPKKEKLKERKALKAKEKENLKCNFFLIMPMIAIVDMIAQYCLLIFSYYDRDGCAIDFSSNCNNKSKINEDDLIFNVAINIVFRYIFSYFLLTLSISFHHKFSIYITFISFIPLIIFNIISLNKANEASEITVYIFLNIFMTILYAFEDVLNKVALNKLVIAPYEVMFYKSLFQLPLLILTIVAICLIDKYDSKNNTINLKYYIKNNKSKLFGRIIYRLSFILSNIFRTLSLIIVIQILTPNHLSILKSLEFVSLSFFTIAKNFNEKQENIIFYIIELICCIFLLFASCIHNEIIIINRCNLIKETDYIKENTDSLKNIDAEIENIKRIIKDNENINNTINDDNNDENEEHRKESLCSNDLLDKSGD